MGSGLPAISPSTARNVVKRMSPLALRRIESLGMTPRQQELNRLWSWYTCCRYDARKVDWDGSERLDPVDAEAIATAGVLPGGFYDAGIDFPLKLRRPSAPYALARVIPNRFTGLLFSESQHPKIRCTGDPDTEDYVGALVDRARLWPAMAQARTYGGAVGTFCVGFKFINGRPHIEVHDPRWVTPHWKNYETLELESIEKRWMWPEMVIGDDGEYEEVWYWTRRIIDAQHDIVWEKVPVGDGDEPNWMEVTPDKVDEHGFGECPAVWGHNIPVSDQEDGEPDCHGVYDQIEEMDALISQAGRAIKLNLDPTTIVTSDRRLNELRKGSDNAIKLEKGGTAGYMEANLVGPKVAMEHVERLRGFILEVSQCVLDDPDEASAAETATKARMRYAAMTNRADTFREQYGQRGFLPLIEKMLRAIRLLGTVKPVEGGGTQRSVVALPPREITNPDGSKFYQPRALPEANDQTGILTVDWPPYFRPSIQDTQAATAAAAQARTAEVIDKETAARLLAPYFDIEDIGAMLDKLKSEAKEDQAEAEARAQKAFAARGGFGGGAPR